MQETLLPKVMGRIQGILPLLAQRMTTRGDDNRKGRIHSGGTKFLRSAISRLS